MIEYVLVAVAILVIIMYLNKAENASNWSSVLFTRNLKAPRLNIPILRRDVPKPPSVKYKPRTIAHSSYESSHAQRLRDTVKNQKGMTLADQALEYKILNPAV